MVPENIANKFLDVMGSDFVWWKIQLITDPFPEIFHWMENIIARRTNSSRHYQQVVFAWL